VAKALEVWEGLAARALDAIVAANPPTYEGFQKMARRTVLVNNYVDLRLFDPSPESVSLKLDLPYFVYCGSLSSQRGALDCLGAFELLSREDTHLLLVGPLDDADTSVSDLSDRLPPRARLLEAQPFEQLPSLLRSSIAGLVTLHPTPNYLEILPTKLFEYMAASIPVIAYDLPLIRAVIEEAGCGLLVKPGDLEGLKSAMSYILDHPTEAREMGRRGRQAVVEGYSWDMEGGKLLRLYEELSSAKPASSQSGREG